MWVYTKVSSHWNRGSSKGRSNAVTDAGQQPPAPANGLRSRNSDAEPCYSTAAIVK